MATFAFAILLLVLAESAAAQDAVRLRVGSHPGYGRLVFDFPGAPEFAAEQQGDVLVLRPAQPAEFDLSAAVRLPRNLRAVNQRDGSIVIEAAPGARLNWFRLSNRLVVDAHDAAAEAPARREPGAAARAAEVAEPPAAQTQIAAQARPAATPSGQPELAAPAEATPARAPTGRRRSGANPPAASSPPEATADAAPPRAPADRRSPAPAPQTAAQPAPEPRGPATRSAPEPASEPRAEPAPPRAPAGRQPPLAPQATARPTSDPQADAPPRGVAGRQAPPAPQAAARPATDPQADAPPHGAAGRQAPPAPQAAARPASDPQAEAPPRGPAGHQAPPASQAPARPASDPQADAPPRGPAGRQAPPAPQAAARPASEPPAEAALPRGPASRRQAPPAPQPAAQPAAEPPAQAAPRGPAGRRQVAIAPPQSPAAPPGSPAGQPAASAQAEPRPAPAPAPPAAPNPPPAAAAVLAPPQAPAIRLLPGQGGPAILIPAEAGTGAALFRRGDTVLFVLDVRQEFDLAALRGDPVFAGLEAGIAGEASVLRLRLAPPALLLARREAAGWVLEASREAPPSPRALVPELDPGPPMRLWMHAAQPGRVVALTDPETDLPLLVGTLREAGQAVRLARRQPEFDLLPTQLGLALLARDDRLAMRALPDRFVLHAAGNASLRLSAVPSRAVSAEAAAMSRVMDLPLLAASALQERLRGQQAAIAAAGPLARGPLRRDAAESLLALGLPQEAQAMATLARQEDPRAEADPRLILAQGAAALLAGRLAEARSLEDPRLPASDETALWRGALAAARGDAGAAPALAATLPLLLAYPEALRARLLASAAAALLDGGEMVAARQLLAALPEEDSLALARARLAEAEGRTEEALAGYDAVARGRDRLRRARAIRHGIELRLAAGRIEAAEAAAALDAALYAWRGDGEEFSARLRIAELRRQAGDGRGAFALLQETERLFPDRAAALRPALAQGFGAALETAPPTAAVALFEAHPQLLPGGAEGDRLIGLLAERLAALDLPDRAAALLRQAADRAPDAAARARIGARLAGLRLSAGDAAGAVAALDASAAEALAGELALERGLLRARALARTGEMAAAEAVLAPLGPQGAALRAELRAEAQDFAGAASAMTEHLQASLPAPPAPLALEQRRALARLAAYAALAGEDRRLAALRAEHGARMQDGPLAEAFALLTADPLRGIADLPRLAAELGLLRGFTARLEALRNGGPATR